MAFFKKFKNNIGLEEETAKKHEEDEYESEDLEECSDEDSQDEKEAEKEIPKDKNKKKNPKKNKNPDNDGEVPVAGKSAFDWLKAKGQLAVDVFQTENEFCVQAPIAGIEQNDVDIAIENEMLIIRGERREPVLGKEKKYFYQECYWGPFSRQIILPEDVNSEKIKASLKSGILVIRIPKAEPKRKKIIVELE
ncbi:MAG: Hsp20/alpha crystallin family protein [Candidatus Pacebacteria bacterium]|nr:Hsp20/alpha crystallin family protein [Candidatus Paceibacterota bacterium]